MKLKQMMFMLTCVFSLAAWCGTAAETKSIVLPSNGIYIFDLKGDFYTSESWNVENNNTVVGIALITDNTKALIALRNANTDGYVVWGPDGLVDGVVTTASNYSNCIPGVAQTDYSGASNTKKEVEQLSPESNTALYLANAYMFPDNHNGYLPALGELIDMFENMETLNYLLEKVDGEKIEDFWYWSSTQHYLYYRAWAYGGTDSEGNKWFAQLRNDNSPLVDTYGPCRINVRAFGTIPQTLEIENDVFGKPADVVDLGLSVKWATWNVGASQEGEYGGLYGMGDSTGNNISTSASDYYYEDGISLSGTEYDLAHTKWGDNWRLPTKEELKEIRDKCTWTHNIKKGDIYGSIATGPNGNQLFLPYSGCRHGEEIRERGYRSSIWSGDAGSPVYAYGFMDFDVCNDGILQMDGCRNWVGQSIRPVYVNSTQDTNMYKLTYMVDGEVYKSYEIEYGAVIIPEPEPKKEGYAFSGWSEIPTTMPAKDVIVTGTFTKIVPISGGEYVDLNLPSGTLWATCNIGANAPEEIGGYFAWGETMPKTHFDRSNYQYYVNDGYQDIGNDISGTKYDAASANWGDGWRMPTRNELKELASNCTRSSYTLNGIPGLLFEGSNGNTIFIPNSGHDYEDESGPSESQGCGLWSSTSYNSSCAYRAWEWSYISFSYRHQGFPIRPVRDKFVEVYKCVTPTISYVKGKLIFNSTTEGAEYVYEIKKCGHP